MERIAFIFGDTFVYWDAVIRTLAVLCAVVLFWGFYLHRSGNVLAAAVFVPSALAVSVLTARFLHWYCQTNSYESLEAAMTDLSSGGFSLAGAVLGCVATALLLRLLQICKNLPQMLDCMSIAGIAGIGVGRLASFFTASDRGQILSGLWGLPWVYPVYNAVTGAPEYRLATFLLQAMVAGVIFLVLAAVYVFNYRRARSGLITLLFAVLYGASQIVLDSTRYDSLYFRSNGFVSVVQVLGAVALVGAIAVLSVQLVKAGGFRRWYVWLWLGFAALIGGAGYMEYHVQRHANQAAMAYSVMTGCLCGVIALWVWMLIYRYGGEKKADV